MSFCTYSFKFHIGRKCKLWELFSQRMSFMPAKECCRHAVRHICAALGGAWLVQALAGPVPFHPAATDKQGKCQLTSAGTGVWGKQGEPEWGREGGYISRLAQGMGVVLVGLDLGCLDLRQLFRWCISKQPHGGGVEVYPGVRWKFPLTTRQSPAASCTALDTMQSCWWPVCSIAVLDWTVFFFFVFY